MSGTDLDTAEEAAQLIQDAVTLKVYLSQRMASEPDDTMLDAYFVNQAKSSIVRSLENGRSNHLNQAGWTGGSIRVESSKERVVIAHVCHGMTGITMTDITTGTTYPRVAGQKATYSVAPYGVDLWISVLEYDLSEFVQCGS